MRSRATFIFVLSSSVCQRPEFFYNCNYPLLAWTACHAALGACRVRWPPDKNPLRSTKMRLLQTDLALLLLLSVPRDGTAERFCMANCSAPLNNFCPLTEDVCAFPTGDHDAQMAVRAMMLEDKSPKCIRMISNFMCAMLFPPCRFRVVVPLCWQDCYDTHRVGLCLW